MLYKEHFGDHEGEHFYDATKKYFRGTLFVLTGSFVAMIALTAFNDNFSIVAAATFGIIILLFRDGFTNRLHAAVAKSILTPN